MEISRVAKVNKLNPKTLEKQYKENLSNFREWEKEVNAQALVYDENFGEDMSIDETSLHDGEFYTVITNKAAHGKKGSLAALIKGTKCEVVSRGLKQVSLEKKFNVKEITADLADSMDWICRSNFPNALKTADRFHVQQIVSEGVQEIRIKLRREAIDRENELKAEIGIKYKPKFLSNGDTEKQLLARSRYFLFKTKNKWTESQKERAEILFKHYPEIEEAYKLAMEFRGIYETSKTYHKAKERITRWFEKVSKSNLKTMISAANTVKANIEKILNYFPNGATNASAESFNAKLKGFRSLVRGVRDINFFLFRISTFYA